MEDYKRFIRFIIFFSAGILWLKNVIPCTPVLFGYLLPCTVLSVGTAVVVVTFVFWAWELLIWRVKIPPFPFLGKIIGLFDYPDLNGNWSVAYESSFNYDHKKNKYRTSGIGKATVTQTYSNLHIYGTFKASSDFESFLSKLQKKENGKWFLVYAYRNKPKDVTLKSAPSGGMHEGFCYLEIDKNCSRMEGYYSNDENRKTRGNISFKKLR